MALKFGLAQRLERARSENARLRMKSLLPVLDTMKIDPNSEVGKFVISQYRPALATRQATRTAYTPDAVFEFLANFGEGSLA